MGYYGFGFLFVHIGANEARELLSEWAWLIDDRDLRPLALTSFGDWFLEDRVDKSVHFLDSGMGKCQPVAFDRFSWLRSLRTPERQQRFLLRQQYDDLQRTPHADLEAGECYSWLLAPVVGGGLSAENVEVTSLELHQRYHARLCRRVHELPPTTVVTTDLVAELVEELADELQLADAVTDLGRHVDAEGPQGILEAGAAALLTLVGLR